MPLTDNQFALACLVVLVIASCIVVGEASKDIALAAVSGVVGWLARGEDKDGKV